MFPFNVFSQGDEAIASQGREVVPASMLVKGVAVAVDLSVTVGMASLLFYLLSTQVPLDTLRARTPIGLVVVAAFAYLVYGRDRMFSPGRHILRLRLMRFAAKAPGLRVRSMSVHRDAEPGSGNEALVKAFLVFLLSTALSLFSLATALSTTQILKTVRDYARSHEIIVGAAPTAIELLTMPRALLVGQVRGYVQVDARGPGGVTTLEFFLRRNYQSWRVSAVREITPSMSANFSLGTRDKDIPSLPSKP